MNRYEVFAVTDTGNEREHNEDAFMINNVVVTKDIFHHQYLMDDFILAVADGVGGENGGEVASRLCLEHLSKITLPVVSTSLDKIIKEINREIVLYGQKHSEAIGLCTTLAGLVCINNRVTVFHVGDSRVYRFRDGLLKQLTKDDTLVQIFYDAGYISREDMNSHIDKNVLYQILGGDNIDEDLEVHIQDLKSEFQDDDVFLICSDGLSDMVSLDAIEAILNRNTSLQYAVQNLLSAAKAQGGLDNITIIAVKKA